MSYPSNELYFPPPPGQAGVPPPLPPRRPAAGLGPSHVSREARPAGGQQLPAQPPAIPPANHHPLASSVVETDRPPPLPPRLGQPLYQAAVSVSQQPHHPTGPPTQGHGWQQDNRSQPPVVGPSGHVFPIYSSYSSSAASVAAGQSMIQAHRSSYVPGTESRQYFQPSGIVIDTRNDHHLGQYGQSARDQPIHTAKSSHDPVGPGPPHPQISSHVTQPSAQPAPAQHCAPPSLSEAPLQVPGPSTDVYTGRSNTFRDQQPWYQDAQKRQDEELQRPEVQKILQQRQVELKEHLERRRQEELQYSHTQPQHLHQVLDTLATNAVAYQHGVEPAQSTDYSQAAQTYTYPQSNPSTAYPTYHNSSKEPIQQYLPQQQYQPTTSDSQPYAGSAWHNPAVHTTNQAASLEQTKRTSSTTKWMNKLNDLSAGLSKLQLQMSAAANAATTSPAPGSGHAAPSIATGPLAADSPANVMPVYTTPPFVQPLVPNTENTFNPGHVQAEAATLPPREPTNNQNLDTIPQAFAALPVPVPAPTPTQPSHNEDIGPQARAEQEHQVLEPEFWVRPMPRLVTAGPPNDIIFDCPGSRALDYEATWYFLPAVPDFLVCTRCHHRYISGTSIASYFHSARLSGTNAAGNKCRFNVPRLTRVLAPQAKQTSDIKPMEKYMKHRLTVKECAGADKVKASDGFKWFGVMSMTTQDGTPLPDIYQYVVICEACYEDHVLGSSFAAKFGPLSRAQPEDQAWMCDIAVTPFFGNAFRRFSQQEKLDLDQHQHSRDKNWLELANLTSPRWGLPACEGFRKAVEPASRKWFRAARLPELVFCEACYLDKIKFTTFEPHFEPADVVSKTGAAWMDFALGYTTEETPLRACQARSRPVIIALGIALARQDMGTLVRAGRTILASPVCTNEGLEDSNLHKLTGGQWFRLSSGAVADDKFRICEACHACLVTTLGLDRYWEAEDPGQAVGKRLVCGLHTGAPWGTEYLARFDEAVDTGVWARFEEYVRVWIDIPPCPRYSHGDETRGRRWYGWEDCLVCGECFVRFCEPLAVKIAAAGGDGGRGGIMEDEVGKQQKQHDGHDGGSQHGKQSGKELLGFLPLHDELIADPRMCCMYSPRMRAMFKAVVEEKLALQHDATTTTTTTTATTAAGAEQDLLAHARHRHAVYARTIPQVRMVQQMREMAMLQSLNSGMVGLMYQGAGAIQTVSGTTDGYLHGVSGGGWHETANHATSAAWFDKSRAEGLGVVSGMGGDMAMVARLMEEWAAVE